MKKVICFLALLFLLDWAFFKKIKPFIIAEFGLGGDQSNGESTTIKIGDYVYGLDISHYQGKETGIPFKKKDSVSFVICKATGGITWKDPEFMYNWEDIATNGFIRGAYHFYLSHNDPVQQVNHFLKVVGPFSDDNFPSIVDVEDSLINKDQLLLFLSIIKDSTNRTPVIYTNYQVAHVYLNDTVFAKYPLWFAHYSSNDPVILPGAWKGREWSFGKNPNITI